MREHFEVRIEVRGEASKAGRHLRDADENKAMAERKRLYLFVPLFCLRFEKNMRGENMRKEIEIKDKLVLSVREASEMSGIGLHRIERMLRQEECPFVLKRGNRYSVKRKQFESYIDQIKEL